MKHIMVNDRVYLVSDEIYGKIVAAFTLANTTDGDMSNIIDTVEKYGKLVGTVYLVKEAGDETIFSYNKKGRFSNDGRGCMCDLFMKAVKREAWINLYKDKDERLFPGLNLFESEKEAKDRMESGEKSNRLYYKTVKIEWEE